MIRAVASTKAIIFLIDADDNNVGYARRDVQLVRTQLNRTRVIFMEVIFLHDWLPVYSSVYERLYLSGLNEVQRKSTE